MNNKHNRLAAVAAALVVCLLQLAAPAWAEPWTSIAPMPTARAGLMVAGVGTHVYAIGGFEDGFCATGRKVEAFDTVTGTWAPRAPMPTARGQGTAVVVSEKIYVIGGNSGCGGGDTVVEVYDPATNAWSPRAPMPAARRLHAAAAHDGKIYVTGGWGDDIQAELFIYDTVADSWITGAPMPYGRTGHGSAAVGGLIYAVGAVYAGDADLIVYDPSTDSWSPLPGVIPENPHTHAVVAVDGAIYSLGGFSEGLAPGAVLARVDRYDFATGTWIAMPSMLSPRWQHAAAVLGGSIYAMGGFSNLSTRLASAEVFNPPPLPPSDTTPPSTVATPTPSANAAGWNHTNVSVALSATDNAGGTGVASVTYAVTGGSGATVLGSIASLNVTAEGVNTVTYHATDVAGNAGADQSLVVRIDKTAPQAIASATPVANAAGWNNTNVNVALAATDFGGSGVASVTYTVANGASSSGATTPGSTASFEVTGEGISTVTYRASDVAGNDGAAQTFVVRIDKTAPAGTLTLSPNVLWPPNNKMVDVQVFLATSDASGPVSVAGPVITGNEAPSAAGDWEVSGTTLRLRAARDGTGDGRIYTIAYTLTDAAGNTRELAAIVTVPHER
jgi:N-acetylneuraminic acid mutarotase